MDLHMPVMGGTRAVQEIRKWELESNVSNVPIILLSADQDLVSSSSLKELIICDFIEKPFRRDKLLTSVSHFLVLNEEDN